MKTIEERAPELIREQFKSTDGGIMSYDCFLAIAIHHMRELAEDCAAVIDNKIEDWKHSMRTIKHFTGTYEEVGLMEDMATAIRETFCKPAQEVKPE
jgi:hypothetical protein